jgi:hypothetical protein
VAAVMDGELDFATWFATGGQFPKEPFLGKY